MNLPQIITDNLNEEIVNKVFQLYSIIPKSEINNERLWLFMKDLTDNDKELSERINDRMALNESYGKLSIIQQKVIKRTFELVLMNRDTKNIEEKYIWEIEKYCK